MSNYLLGLATLPAIGLLYLLTKIGITDPGKVWIECRYCSFARRPGWRPWWLWHLYKRRDWREHVRLSHTCRERINGFNERNGRGWRYNERGRRVDL